MKKEISLKRKLFGIYVFIAIEFAIYYTIKMFIDNQMILNVIKLVLIFLPVILMGYGGLQEFRKTFVIDKIRFSDLDMVIDTGSKIRKNEVGVLKHDDGAWFIIYFDGFEAKVSQLENLVKKR